MERSLPIFIIRVPSKLEADRIGDIKANAERKLGGEYHVFVVNDQIDSIAFECHNAENVPPIDLEDLKKKLECKA